MIDQIIIVIPLMKTNNSSIRRQMLSRQRPPLVRSSYVDMLFDLVNIVVSGFIICLQKKRVLFSVCL